MLQSKWHYKALLSMSQPFVYQTNENGISFSQKKHNICFIHQSMVQDQDMFSYIQLLSVKKPHSVNFRWEMNKILLLCTEEN